MSGNPNLKNRHAFSSAVDNKLYEAFEQIQKETRIPKSKLFDEAIQLLIEKYKPINKT